LPWPLSAMARQETETGLGWFFFLAYLLERGSSYIWLELPDLTLTLGLSIGQTWVGFLRIYLPLDHHKFLRFDGACLDFDKWGDLYGAEGYTSFPRVRLY
jgi:hypothetical protein